MELSVIIPTYNRGSTLMNCLRALAEQATAPSQYEIIVSDDGSPDRTADLVRSFAKDHPALNLSCLRQDNAGANKARNEGLRNAQGPLLLFINDDTIATRTLLEEHLRIHRLYDEEGLAVLGKVTASPESAASPFGKLHLDAAFDRLPENSFLGWEAFFTCNVSVRKSFLMQCGLFEERLRYHEDLELSERLSHHGLRVFYNPMALGFHDHVLKEEEYLSIGRREGVALAQWYKMSPHLRKELTSLGFYKGLPFPKRLKYAVADGALNRWSRPVILSWARNLAGRHEALKLAVYRKIFQSLKREAIRHELRG